MLDGRESIPCAVILTAIPVEYSSVRAHLTNLRSETHERGNYYERGTFSVEEHTWEVVIVEVGAGNALAAVQTERAISYFKPKLILFVGVAGGLKEVRLGDVIVATKVYAYESGKANETFQPRPDVGITSFRMSELARLTARKQDWLKRLKGPIPDPPPSVKLAPIAAGGSVVASTHSATWEQLRQNYSDAVAVEMEGHGFLQAVHANPGVEALVIRGISDCIDDKEAADKMNFQAIAARHACAFAFEILATLDGNQPLLSMNTAATSNITEEQQAGELINEPKESQEQAETPLSESQQPIFVDPLSEFYGTLSHDYAQIELAFSPFNSELDIYQDQCNKMIKALINLGEHMKKLRKDANTLDVVVGSDLDNIEDTASDLQTELRKFLALCPPKGTLFERRQYTSAHKKIRGVIDNFLQRLRDFKTRLNKNTSLE